MLIDFRVYLASIDLHETHHDDFLKVTSQYSLKDPLTSFLKEVNIRYVFHCDGLLLCTTKDYRLVVWNPCSGETRWIKPRDSYKKYDYYALGKSSCNNYKILRMDQRGDGDYSCLVEYEVYDLTTNSWRVVGWTTKWSIPRGFSRGTSVNGNTYWLALSYNQGYESGNILLCFDFSIEKFGVVSLPAGDPLSYHLKALSVTREEQKLCLLATRNIRVFDIDVWMATKIDESNGSASWSKLLSVKERTYRPLPFCFCTGVNFLVDRENKVIVCRGKNGVSNGFLNILGEYKCMQVDHHDAGSECSLVVSYVPSLVKIQ